MDELEKALGFETLPGRAHLETDSDLDALRNEPRFLALLEKSSA